MKVSKTSQEISTQPEMWLKAAALSDSPGLPQVGERVLVLGCGTSWFIAQAYAALREASGHGETDVATATEAPLSRKYDRILTISRSGTTTEIIDVLQHTRTATTVITAVSGSPTTHYADTTIVLDFADEESVVQTRFATSVLALLRAHLGENIAPTAARAREILNEALPPGSVEAPQITFLGSGWSIGLAHEAALKLREAAQSWTESYVAMEYRHGPISIAEPGRIVWCFGPVPDGLAEDVTMAGATFVNPEVDPLVSLVLAQRLAVARAEAQGLNPDSPRSLTRSVILSETSGAE